MTITTTALPSLPTPPGSMPSAPPRIDAPPPPINSKSSGLTILSNTPPDAITIPFQIQVTALGTADASDSVSIAANSALASITAPFRRAILTSLKATIQPTGTAPSYPTTVSLCWVPYNSSATASQILSVYGGQMFCIGGTVGSTLPISVPCDLSSINPTVKDAVTLTDTPKLLYSSTAQATAPTVATCYLTISGKVSLSSPLLQSSA